MRRRQFLGAAALGALTLAGCGGSDAGGGAASGSADAGGTFPARVEHRYGTTTVERAPRRVVVAGLREQDALIALGVVPVAVTKWLDETIHPWAQAKLGDRPAPAVIPSSDDIDVEKIAAQRPDLIVAVYSALTQQQYETLSKLAPVVAAPAGVPEFGTDFRVETEMVGAAVGKPDEAKRLVEGVNRDIAAAREAHPEFAGRSGSAATSFEGVYVFGATDARPTLLRALGFEIPAAIDAITKDDFGANLSEERLDVLDTDVVLWQLDAGSGPATVLDDPAVKPLAAAKEGRIVFSSPEDPDDADAALTFNTVLSLPVVLDAFVPRIAAAVDGDPATSTDA